MSIGREQLVEVVQEQARSGDVCDSADAHLCGTIVRERLAAVGVVPDEDLGVAFMAVAMMLAERSPEFGGDARDTLGLVARIGLELLAPHDS